MGYMLFQLSDNKWYFIASQLGLGVLLVVGLYLAKDLSRPAKSLRLALDSLQDQDPNSSMLPTGQSDVDKMIGIYNRMLSILRTERYRLEDQGRFLQDLVAAAPIGVLIADFDDVIQESNLRAQQLLLQSAEVLTGQTIQSVLPTWNQQTVGQPLPLTTADGRKLRAHINKVHYKGFFRRFVLIEDLTAELLSAEKEAYGRVIRMMSHEVNNATGAINSILQSLHEYFDQSNQASYWLEALLVAQDRNLALGQFVANFAKVIKIYAPQKQSVKLHDLCEKALKLWQFEAANRHIRLNLVGDGDDRPIDIDPVQIDQILHNVIKNAFEAIDHQYGEVTVLVSGHGSHLTVTNNGQPLDSSIHQHLNQPFFSTKANGQGIGLMITREILANHQTTYRLQTGDDSYTRFSVQF